ncbi:MAG: hypothetical protein OXT74_12755, partial [Candidatus Poribacteria bacterium]|nr:hypothetical protein [Candidatus Poribacteria bacterium]
VLSFGFRENMNRRSVTWKINIFSLTLYKTKVCRVHTARQILKALEEIKRLNKEHDRNPSAIEILKVCRIVETPP